MSMLAIEPLVDRQDVLPIVQDWFETEWPEYYGSNGRANARQDLLSYSRLDRLPLGLVAFFEGRACGFIALKDEPFATHPHLRPWAGAAYVVPSLRRKGIGGALLLALERQALAMGYTRIYCATSTSASLLERSGWAFLEQVTHEAQDTGIYEKGLGSRDFSGS